MIDYTKGLDVEAMILGGVTLSSLSNEDLLTLFKSTEITNGFFLYLKNEVATRFLSGNIAGDQL